MPDTITLDTAGALDLWKRLAPPEARNLLEAEDEATAEEKRKRCRRREERDKDENRDFCVLLFLAYFWDSEEGFYRNGQGQPVLDQGVHRSVNTFADRVANQMAAYGSQVADKTIPVDRFAAIMRQLVNAAHTAAYAAGAGGLARLVGDTLEKAVEAVLYHLLKLEQFIAAIRRGEIDNPAEIVHRARLYGVSVPTTKEKAKSDVFEEIEKAIEDEADEKPAETPDPAKLATESDDDNSGKAKKKTRRVVEERNVLGEAEEHCSPNEKQQTEGCRQLADLGWVPRGTMSRPGQRTCRMGCRCRLEFRVVRR